MPGTNGVPTPIDRVAMDVNADGRITLADVLSWPGAVFFLPGDGLLWAASTYAPPVARLLDIGPSDYGGLLSGVVSAFAWIAAFLSALIFYAKLRDLDGRLTAATVRAYATATLRARIARALLLQRLREWRARRQRSSAVEISTDVVLSPIQLKALRLHATLPPGYVRSVSEVARGLGAPPRAVENLLGELKRLGLLVRASCGADGESGYALSAGGRALLDFHARASRPPDRSSSGKPPVRSGTPRERPEARAEAHGPPRTASRPRLRPR
jgi:hypothetical protein